ncbi:MAG: monooxygenase, partial [Burkholderiales bacterium]|nr:monooxygenase [Burkholderiales bacterium]
KLRAGKTAGITIAGRGFAASLFHRDAKFCRARNENSKKTDFVQAAAAISRVWSQHLPLRA